MKNAVKEMLLYTTLKIIITVKIANRKKFTQFEKQYYAPSIKEANAWGFTSPINAKINRDFYNSVEEAHYKLRKYISLEDLKRMIDEK